MHFHPGSKQFAIHSSPADVRVANRKYNGNKSAFQAHLRIAPLGVSNTKEIKTIVGESLAHRTYFDLTTKTLIGCEQWSTNMTTHGTVKWALTLSLELCFRCLIGILSTHVRYLRFVLSLGVILSLRYLSLHYFILTLFIISLFYSYIILSLCYLSLRYFILTLFILTFLTLHCIKLRNYPIYHLFMFPSVLVLTVSKVIISYFSEITQL